MCDGYTVKKSRFIILDLKLPHFNKCQCQLLMRFSALLGRRTPAGLDAL